MDCEYIIAAAISPTPIFLAMILEGLLLVVAFMWLHYNVLMWRFPGYRRWCMPGEAETIYHQRLVKRQEVEIKKQEERRKEKEKIWQEKQVEAAAEREKEIKDIMEELEKKYTNKIKQS